jgi:hypothetical protein
MAKWQYEGTARRRNAAMRFVRRAELRVSFC